MFVQLERAPLVLLRCRFVQQRLRGPAERALRPLTAAATRTEASGCRLLWAGKARGGQAGRVWVPEAGGRVREFFYFYFFVVFFFLSFLFFYDFFFCVCMLLFAIPRGHSRHSANRN